MAGPKGSRYYDIFLKNKIWLESKEGSEIVSEQILKLLNLINNTHSLKSAAEEIGVSYRKAWGDLKETETRLGFFLVERTRGGEHGGQSKLTDSGMELVEAYSELVYDVDVSIKKITKKFFHKINKSE